MGVVGQFFVFNGIKTLIGARFVQSAELFYVRTGFDVVEVVKGKTGRELLSAGIPTGFDIFSGPSADKSCQPLYGYRIRITAHKADAAYGTAVFFQKQRKRILVQRLARILPEPGTVATRTTIGTTGEVYGQRNLSGDLLKYDIITAVP